MEYIRAPHAYVKLVSAMLTVFYLFYLFIFVLNRSKQEEMVLADMHLKPGEAWEYCPREALRRVSKVLKDEFNLVGLMLYVCEIQSHSTSKCTYAGDECRFRK